MSNYFLSCSGHRVPLVHLMVLWLTVYVSSTNLIKFRQGIVTHKLHPPTALISNCYGSVAGDMTMMVTAAHCESSPN